MNWKELLEQLSQPFDASDIQWRAGATTRDKKKAQALPYAEPRVYEDRLNEICPGDWSVIFKPWGENKLICELTLLGVTRSSTGEFDASDKISQGTTAEAQSFKRACSKFGLGRYLYEIDVPWVAYDQEKGKLLETPTLSAKFLPKAPGTKPQAQPAKKYIGTEGAVALERQLRGYKINNVPTIPDVVKFVQYSCNRKIMDMKALETLTPDEAHKVLEDAKEAHQNARQKAASEAQKKTTPKSRGVDDGRITQGATYEESFGRN